MGQAIPAAVGDELCSAVRAHLPGALHELLQALELGLGERSLQAFSNRDAEACNQLQRLCRARGRQVVEQVVIRICHDLPQGTAPRQGQEALDNSSEWSLVDDAEVDDLLEAKRLVRVLRETLGPLEWRVCSCLARLSGLQPREGDSPLSLEYLLRQLQEALQLRQQGAPARLVFQECAQRVLMVALMGYLQALLEVLQRHHVEPLGAVPQPERQSRPVLPSQRQGERAAPYRAFHELRQARDHRGQGGGEGAAGMALGTVLESPPGIGLGSGLGSGLGNAGGRAEPDLSRGFATLRERGSAQNWGPGQWLGELERQGCRLSVRQREDAALVGELFSTLDQDDRIASALKPQLNRLLPSVLQAALQDPRAFADAEHPLRGTLDRVLQLSDACDPPNRALETRLQELIQRIAADFDGDVAVLQSYQQELDSLLAIQQRSYRTNAERVMQFHRGRDTLEQARHRVEQVLGEMFDEDVPQVLLDWLSAGWQELLVHELIRDGEDNLGWRADLALIKLLKRWLDGELGPQEELERAYQVDHLLDLLRRRLDDFQAGQYRYLEVLGDLRRQLLGEQPICRVASPRQEQDAPLPTGPGLERWRERLESMRAGDWLRDASGRALQLIWVNPTLKHFVLVDRQGREAGSYTDQQLIGELAAGTLLPSDTQPESEGVVQHALQDIVGRLYHEIAHARSHDELTGLLNRRSFELAVAQCLARPGTHCFLLAHVDLFILLNQQAGSVGGDACLRHLGQRLGQELPEGASLARIGGVDFGLVLPGTTEEQALALAERWRLLVESEGFSWETHHHRLSLSIGVLEAGDRHDVATVLGDLQSACNSAKQAGRNRVHSFQAEHVAEHGGLLAIAARVDEIVEREQLGLRLQQITPLLEGDELPHHELLLVMENDLQLVDFISAAERYQRMPRVDRWVLRRIFGELERNPQVWRHSSSISINLSGSSINDDKLLGFIESLFEQYAVEPSRICFELTETAAVANLAKTADLVRHLQRAGCRFSIDDFGVGFSSFDYLKRLPVDYVKIDGSFVREIEHSPGDLAMVRSINEIAHALGRQTIAEYVESEAIALRLKEMGVDYAQGFGIARPRPLTDWLVM